MLWPRTKAHLAVLISVGLLVLTIVLTAYGNLRDYEKAIDGAEHARRALTAEEALLSDLKDAETGERGYLLTRNSQYLEPYTASLPHITTDLAQLTEPGDVDADPATLMELRLRVASVLSLLAGTISDERRGNVAGATAIGRADSAKAGMDKIRTLIDRLMRAEQRQFDSRTAAMHRRRAVVRTILVTGTIAIPLFLTASGMLINRLIRAYERSREIAQSERDRFETTLQSIGDAVIVTDACARVTRMPVTKRADSIASRAAAIHA